MQINDKWEFYQDAQGQWWWRLIAPNSTIASTSTEGYASRNDCERNAFQRGWEG